MSLDCLIIDDEPLAREGIANYVRQVDFLQLRGLGANPIELGNLLAYEPADLIFLDIQMPLMNGLDFLRQAPNAPLVIITTAFPGYAVESFSLDVLDYLLKPVTFNRFYQAANKARQQWQLRQAGPQTPARPSEPAPLDHFFVKCENKYEKIFFAELLFVQAMQNYVLIHTTRGKYVTLLYLKNVAENLIGQPFLRVHKSYIVATDKITAVDQHELSVGTHRIPVSRRYREEVMQRIVRDKLWKK